MSLKNVDANAFESVFNLWCGKEGRAEQLGEVMIMASEANRLEMLGFARRLRLRLSVTFARSRRCEGGGGVRGAAGPVGWIKGDAGAVSTGAAGADPVRGDGGEVP